MEVAWTYVIPKVERNDQTEDFVRFLQVGLGHLLDNKIAYPKELHRINLYGYLSNLINKNLAFVDGSLINRFLQRFFQESQEYPSGACFKAPVDLRPRELGSLGERHEVKGANNLVVLPAARM